VQFWNRPQWQFSNGISENVYQIPIATQLSGNAYSQSNSSGGANINLAGSAAAGTIASNSLEESTVDLSSEFTRLIDQLC